MPFRLLILIIPLALGFGACGSDSSGVAIDAGPGRVDAGTDASPGQGSGLIFDESEVRTYELTMTPADWTTLQENGQDEVYLPGSLRFEGVDTPNVGVRFKGAIGSLQFQGPIDSLQPCFDFLGKRQLDNCPKLGMKVKVSEYDKEQRFYTVKRLQFHSMGNDPTKMVERLSYSLFREMGVFAPRTSHARLLINGEYQGLFILVEQIDGRFTRENMPDGGEGNLYKEVWPVHSTEAPYIDALKTNQDEMPSGDKMVRFAAALEAANDSNWEEVLEQWTDVDMLMAKMAVDRAIEHWDGIVAWYCDGGGGNCTNHNFYWYESSIEDKVWLLPWDMDRAMVWPTPIRTLYNMPDWDDDSDCSNVSIFFGISGKPPACDKFIGSTSRNLWPRYVAKTEEFLAGPFQLSALEAKVDAYTAQLAPFIDEDPAIDRQAWDAAVIQLKSDLASMRISIQQKIAP